jgi:lipopolysaccharide/colanic/teichoic acid biosynthesis glycosyltransferase
MVLLAVMIVLDSRGPAIFVQDRVGQNGRHFKIYKFRTMVPYAENKGPLLAVRGDPRVTRVGRFLRRWSLDEIPQLFNIIKGDMAVVGPRPEIPPLVNTYSAWQNNVLSVKPGLTGFSQVMGRDELDMDRKIRLDIYYIRRRTFCFDLWILFRTIGTVISGQGAF